MKPYVLAAAAFALALPAAPALAHCGTAHHRVAARKTVHRLAYRTPLRRHVVRVAACGCAPRVAYRTAYVRPAVYPIVYRPHLVRIAYVERPLYRPWRPHYRPWRAYYEPRFHRPYRAYRTAWFERGGRYGGYGRHAWR